MSESRTYDARTFWDGILSARFDLTGVGHGGFGPRYNAYLYRAKRRAFHRALRAGAVDVRGKDVLDVGCGTGFLTAESHALGCGRYTGVDISDTSVRGLRERYPADRFELADIGAVDAGLVRRLGDFDVVYCFDVLYHVVDGVRFRTALANLWSLVRRGGVLLVVDAFWKRDLIPGGSLEPKDGYVPHVVFHKRGDYDRHLFSAPDLELRALVPMYALFNRPIEAKTWPWTSKRWSWHIRRRLLESRAALMPMYAFDGSLTRLRRTGPDLKIAVARKAP